ncbi:MAG: hypothetical protein MUP70_11760 [Candidatus Aminicenantes bacterium]|nr:hypothetical protein [Candidatus Aminicenantes bacterium]
MAPAAENGFDLFSAPGSSDDFIGKPVHLQWFAVDKLGVFSQVLPTRMGGGIFSCCEARSRDRTDLGCCGGRPSVKRMWATVPSAPCRLKVISPICCMGRRSIRRRKFGLFR